MKAESRSIRQSVIWRFSIFALSLSLIYSMLIIFVAFVVEDQVIENLLETEAQHLKTHYSNTHELPESNLAFVRVYSSLGEAAKSLPGNVEIANNDEEVFVDGPAHYHVKKIIVTYKGESRSFVMLAEVGNLLSVSRLSKEIVALFLLILLLGLLLAVWQAYTLAKNTTQPIVALAKNVAHLANKSASKAIRVEPVNNEIVYLSAVIDLVFSNLEQSLGRERAFTQDVSHELRTPLTVFQNTLALITQRGWQATDQGALLYATDKMQMTINTLLIMAREGAYTIQNVPLRPIIEQTVLNCYQRLEEADIQVSIDVEDRLALLGNKDLLNLIVVNLLENTLQHSSGCELTIMARSTTVIFKNTQTSKVNSDSTQNMHSGLGLVLVKRMADQMKWQTQVTSTEEYFSVSFLIA